VISRRRKLRQTSTGSKQVRPWRPDLNETASTETGLIHSVQLGKSQMGVDVALGRPIRGQLKPTAPCSPHILILLTLFDIGAFLEVAPQHNSRDSCPHFRYSCRCYPAREVLRQRQRPRLNCQHLDRGRSLSVMPIIGLNDAERRGRVARANLAGTIEELFLTGVST
jgi:hypothetical protein